MRNERTSRQRIPSKPLLGCFLVVAPVWLLATPACSQTGDAASTHGVAALASQRIAASETSLTRLSDGRYDPLASITIGGPPVSVTTTAPGQIASLTFSGTASQRISSTATGVPACTNVSIVKPDGTTLASSGACGGVLFVDATTLPVTGTYSIKFDPVGTAVGTAAITLAAVPDDATASISIGGPAVSVTTTAPGQNASLTFAGTAGLEVRLRATGLPGCGQLWIVKPDGTNLIAPTFYCSSLSLAATKLPTAGTYTIKIDPSATAIGTATLTLGPNLYAGTVETLHAGGITIVTDTAKATYQGYYDDKGFYVEQFLSGNTTTTLTDSSQPPNQLSWTQNGAGDNSIVSATINGQPVNVAPGSSLSSVRANASPEQQAAYDSILSRLVAFVAAPDPSQLHLLAETRFQCVFRVLFEAGFSTLCTVTCAFALAASCGPGEIAGPPGWVATGSGWAACLLCSGASTIALFDLINACSGLQSASEVEHAPQARQNSALACMCPPGQTLCGSCTANPCPSYARFNPSIGAYGGCEICGVLPQCYVASYCPAPYPR